MMSSARQKHPKRYVSDTRIKERPLAFVDLEFSGLDLQNEILQIGCVIVSQPDFKVIREWQTRVKPEHIRNGDEQALKMVGYTATKWRNALPLRTALERFNEVAEDAVLIGYNIAWDFFFLKKSYAEVQVKPAFHWQILDVLSMIYFELYRSRLDGFRMREVVKYLKLKEGQWHDALVDARATYEIFMKLVHRKENI